ncbi:DUF5690 family protein [Alteraurantiacibacter aquimixticola]|uniref:DUF5690 family protein n=1 Tax=Alteraurantiacibacter aquimixticola TaxID=2489173 RepID=UPI001B7D7F7E|nr:DUF5690 family protein [Alteraurantiacibacter aquimixticola]
MGSWQNGLRTGEDWLRRKLAEAHPAVFALYGGGMAFGTYFAMYAYRKPFTAATFEPVAGWEIDYKIILVLAQIVGYALSKVIGIRVVSEVTPNRRAASILVCVLAAEGALVGFWLVPPPYNAAFLFLNGLPLGMIWGLVFGFLEGRRLSEVLGAILCASFIIASGVVRSVGKWTMNAGLADAYSMPALTGLVFAPLLMICVGGLACMPEPDHADRIARRHRAPMNRAARRALLRAYAPGFAALIVLYVMLTALRDFRDNFAAEIWEGLGYGDSASVFALSEIPGAVIVLVALAALVLIKDNFIALVANFLLIATGLVMITLSTLLFESHILSPLVWMMLLGTGLYLGYTPFSAMLFDRMIANTQAVATAGFLIYVADASGYAGSVALVLLKSFGNLDLAWVDFLILASYATAGFGFVLLFLAMLYFRARLVGHTPGHSLRNAEPERSSLTPR